MGNSRMRTDGESTIQCNEQDIKCTEQGIKSEQLQANLRETSIKCTEQGIKCNEPTIKYTNQCDEARILQFLADVKVNNTRDWFHENRERFDDIHGAFEQIVGRLIAALATFDPAISTVTVKSTLYRFYRDTRFSPDKSPYKRHLGSYINPRGKKSPHGGYYLHLEPGHCLIGGGAYCLESPILKAVRTSIVDNLDTFRSIVEAPEFHDLFPVIGNEHLKTMPVGFPRDFAYPQYLRPKNFAVMHPLPDEFFFQKDWITKVAAYFKIMKPFLDFINDTIDDYID